MPILNKTQMRGELQKFYGLSERQAKNAVARLARVMEFHELAALFAGDPTAMVAVLRAAGFLVNPRYARPTLRAAS